MQSYSIRMILRTKMAQIQHLSKNALHNIFVHQKKTIKHKDETFVWCETLSVGYFQAHSINQTGTTAVQAQHFQIMTTLP